MKLKKTFIITHIWLFLCQITWAIWYGPYHRGFITHIIWGRSRGKLLKSTLIFRRIIKITTTKIRSIKSFWSKHVFIPISLVNEPFKSLRVDFIFDSRTLQRVSIFMTDLFAIYVAHIPYLLFEIVQGQHGNYYYIINELLTGTFFFCLTSTLDRPLFEVIDINPCYMKFNVFDRLHRCWRHVDVGDFILVTIFGF